MSKDASPSSASTVALCKHSVSIRIDANRKIFEGSSEWETESCSSGIAVDIYNAEMTQKTASLVVSHLSRDRVRVELRDFRDSVRLVGEVATDNRKVSLSAGTGATAFVAHIAVSHVDGSRLLTVNATNLPAFRVVADAIALNHRKIQGAELTRDARVTMQFDAIPFISLMELIADASDSKYEAQDDGAGTFVSVANP
ncbi:MAG: hypothetical protein ABI411_19865 [Tahibacter sp.]